MRGNSTEIQNIFFSSNEKLFFVFNQVESTKTDPMTNITRNNVDFEYVEVKDKNRDSLIDAVISDKYPKAKEIALINNEIASPGTPEYIEYQSFRTIAKQIVDTELDK